MKKFLEGLKRFFYPAPGSKWFVMVLPYAAMGLLTALVLGGAVYGWDYTNSPTFCGTTCHTMPPEYSAYEMSVHARVACVECHIGRAFVGTQFLRKAGDLKHVFYTLTNTFTYPIFAKDMSPARESCEKCHSPEKFSSDSLREKIEYANDQNNTPSRTYLVMKIGGGLKREGLGKGIHWHVESKVQYYATDSTQQNIPYVRVYNDDGTYTEYVDVQSGFDPKSIQDSQLITMDCITCHNRVTHLVNQPSVIVDNALNQGQIDPAIPFIRSKAVEVLGATYISDAQGLVGIASLDNFYQTYYGDYYTANSDKIKAAISYLQDTFKNSVYLDQKSDWNTHPNNVGHKYSPGCFRCHDGKHLDSQQQAVRLECNLCHAIPVVATNANFVTNVQLASGPEPDSHLHPNWIAMHRDAYNGTCKTCHDTKNPGGTDNSSFCSNSACHGNVWTYAGFNAPALREVILKQLPPTPTPAPETGSQSGPLTWNDTIGPLLATDCGGCHGASGGMKNLNLTTYQGALTGGDDGPAVVPGDVAASLLMQKQTGDVPHFFQLNAAEIDLVKSWIEAGAPEANP